MVRTILVAIAGLLTACSAQPQPASQAAATPVPARAAPTADALAAKQVAQRYFDLLRTGAYAEAWALWSDDTASAAGGLKAFAAASRAQGRFEGKAGDPTDVREKDGIRFVLVESTARVTAADGKASDQAGVLMLKRPARDGAAWRIWGVDIRRRHCSKGQVAQGLGCVPA